MKRLVLWVAVGVAVGGSAAHAETLDVRTGLWEITSTGETPGGSSKLEVAKACIDDQTLRRGVHFSPGKRGNCTRTLLHGSSRQIELRLECTGKEKATGTFSIEANDRQTFNGRLDLVVNSDANPVAVRRTMQGKWLGNDCGPAKRPE
ncbi:MAG: DUF3617 family protein [Acetobacteraceae bacterium]